jgi:hypothetical protein
MTTAITRRHTKSFQPDGSVRVKVEEGPGTPNVVAEYTVPTIVEVDELAQSSSDRTQTATSIDCPPSLVSQVDAIIFTAAENGGRCLRNAGMSAEAAAVAQVSVRPFDIRCETGPGRRAAIDTASASDPYRRILLIINVDRWNAEPAARELTVFHEFLHTVLPEDHDPILGDVQNTNDRRWRELDRISACNSLCYNPNVTRCECARCLRKESCDAPCNSYADCYTDQSGAVCPCPAANRRWYDRRSVCESECPSGLGCFTATCIPESNACKPPF